MNNCYSGTLFIVAAPSGGGKTSLVRELVSNLDNIAVSISHTTRSPRVGEQDGVDYFFTNESTFNKMIEASAFLEYAQVFNCLYGTSTAQIAQRLQSGIDVVLDIDWQGAQQIRQAFPEAVSVFVIPPSLEALKQRLHARQDKAEAISSRMHKAQDELSHYTEFDYLLVNDTFTKAANELQAIVTTHRLRISRQSAQQSKLLAKLLAAK